LKLKFNENTFVDTSFDWSNFEGSRSYTNIIIISLLLLESKTFIIVEKIVQHRNFGKVYNDINNTFVYPHLHYKGMLSQ